MFFENHGAVKEAKAISVPSDRDPVLKQGELNADPVLCLLPDAL